MSIFDLDPGHRLLILSWIRDGIEHGIRRSVSTRAYHVFLQGVDAKDGVTVFREFDVERFFSERLKPHEQQHFERVARTLEYLDELIDDCEQELDADDDDDQVDEEVVGGEGRALLDRLAENAARGIDPDAAVPGFAAGEGVSDDSES